MGIVPDFELAQDDATVTLTAVLKFVRLSNFEIDWNDFELKLFVKPYRLHLHFECPLSLDHEPQAEYCTETCLARIILWKQNPGEEFPNLHMVSRLLAPRNPHRDDHGSSGSKCIKPLIEELASSRIETREQDAQETGSRPNQSEVLFSRPSYGFMNKYSSIFDNRQEIAKEILQLPQPDRTPASMRSQLRKEDEVSRFDAEHYAADFMLEDKEEHIIAAKSFDVRRCCGEAAQPFTENQRRQLERFARRPVLIGSDEVIFTTLLQVCDILFAYLYDLRTSDGEPNVESAWTISTVSAVLSWFEPEYATARDAILAPFGRSLIFPWVRSFNVAHLVAGDVAYVFHNGRQSILGLLLNIHKIFEKAEAYHILNDLYITDLCVWIQYLPDNAVVGIAQELSIVVAMIRKQDLDVIADLEAIEHMARIGQDASESSTDVSDCELASDPSSSSDGDDLVAGDRSPQAVKFSDEKEDKEERRIGTDKQLGQPRTPLIQVISSSYATGNTDTP